MCYTGCLTPENEPRWVLLSVMSAKTFDLIKSGAVGRNEVHVPARASRQPRLDLIRRPKIPNR